MNTIIIHLESISMMQLQQFPNLYFMLYNLPIKRCWFNKFYSTCTSTIMAIADMLSGDLSRYEKSISPSYLTDSKPHNLLLNEVTPINKAFFYPNFWNEDDALALRHLFSDLTFFNDYSLFRKEIEIFMRKNDNFTLFIYDGSSSLAMLEDAEFNSRSYLEHWYNGKLRTIETVYFVIETLFTYKLQDKVQLLIYGDHGNDFLTHKSGGGHTHCFEPYNNLIHVPLIYYHPLLESHQVENVLSMESLHALLINGLSCNINDNFFTQFLDKQESFAFARNFYSNQSGVDMKLKKAYSITDGIYNLIVSCEGVKMYASNFDPTNHCNLLSYFLMQPNGMLEYQHFCVSENMPKQFTFVINQKRALEIIDAYTILQSKLHEAIKTVSEEANMYLFDDLDFKRINYNSS